MHEYLAILPIADIKHDAVFASDEALPLHCTLMSWFTLCPSLDPIHFTSVLMTLADEQSEAIELVSKAQALFGYQNDVPVHVLERNDALNLLHNKLLKLLFEAGAEIAQLQWVGAGYRPHVTNVRGCSFPPGARHHANSLMLIQCDERKNKRVTMWKNFGV